MARILLVRHAQSEWNLLGRWQGWADPPLSPLGLDQAERAGRQLLAVTAGTNDGNSSGSLTIGWQKPQTVVSSDLQRARVTASTLARLALPDAAVGVDHDLREYRVGEWSGLTRVQIEEAWPGLLDRWDQGDLSTPPGGEDRDHFETRLFQALDRAAAVAGVDRCCLVVSHGGAIRAVARRLHSPVDHVGNLAGVVIDGADGHYAWVAAIDLLHAKIENPEADI